MRNTGYSITYKRKLSESYQVITFEKGKLKIHELEMLRRNQLTGFLPVEFMLADGKGQFWYNITGLQSLEDIRKTGRFQERTLRSLVEGLGKILKIAEQYALREESIRLEEIFFSPDQTKVYFGYLPLKTEEEETAREKLLHLLDELIKTADYRDNDYVTYLFSLYEALGRENAGMDTLLDIPVKEQTISMEETETSGWEDRVQQKAENIDFQKIEEAGKEKLPIRDRVLSGLKETVKNKYLDEVWELKKKVRNFRNLKPERREEVTLIEPEEYREESRNTAYLKPSEGTEDREESLGKESREGILSQPKVGMIRFADPGKESLFLTQPRYVVGKREEYANLVVEDASVSRVHALIVREEDGYYLEDLNSLNGTFLNGSLLELKERVRLKSRDEIGVGNSTLFFEES